MSRYIQAGGQATVSVGVRQLTPVLTFNPVRLWVPKIQFSLKILVFIGVGKDTPSLTDQFGFPAVAFFMNLFPALLVLFRTLFASRLELVAENLALRQQLAVLNRTAKRPKLQFQDRLFWAIFLSNAHRIILGVWCSVGEWKGLVRP